MTHHPRSLRLGILLVLGAVSVGALLTPTAHAAAAQMLSVFVTNTAANPVPVIARDPEASHEPPAGSVVKPGVVPGGSALRLSSSLLDVQ